MLTTAARLWTCLTLALHLAATGAGATDPGTPRVWPEMEEPLVPAFFQPTAEETFEEAFSTGRPEGFLTSREGLAVYCGPADRPLEIHWSRPARAEDQPAIAEGYGEISLKYVGDRLVRERYRGEFLNGFREGRGELLARGFYGDNAFRYQGEFHQGRLEGQGVYVSYDFGENGEAPFIYKGEFRADTFHGQGVMTDLVTGRIIHSGLWFEGFPFQGGPQKWARANRRAGLDTQIAARPAPAASAGDR